MPTGPSEPARDLGMSSPPIGSAAHPHTQQPRSRVDSGRSGLTYAQQQQLSLGARLGIGWIVIVLCGACLGLCSGDVEQEPGDGTVEVGR